MGNNTSPVVNLDFLAQMFSKVFDVPASAFAPAVTALKGDGGITELDRTEFGTYGAPYYEMDAQGREYFMPVQVMYTNASNQQITYQLPFPVVSIKPVKHVMDTEMTEVNGMVSELISIKAYEINIKGFCFDLTGDEYPESDVISLRNLFECNQPISIKNVLTDIFLLRPERDGSDWVTIRECDFPFEVGTKSIQAYTIKMLSETPFSLIEI